MGYLSGDKNPCTALFARAGAVINIECAGAVINID
jgi:hypothetical protein